MDAEAIGARVREAGLAETLAVDPHATIRLDPAAAADAIGQTLGLDPAAPASREATSTARALPRLSVDLRVPEGVPRGAVDATADLEVRAVLGEGGMGRVLLARQHSIARDVAVKTAKEDAPPSATAAILAEGAITGQLEHPAIVPVHALGLDAMGRPAMVMKRVEGVSWSALLRDPAHAGWEGGEGTPEDRLPGHLAILTAICNALHFAHSRGWVHRDVKPENVLIGRFGDVYLADWGLAAPLGEEGSRLCGTPGYLAPEMARGARVDARTDVYLVGATLHEILTGELRHNAETLLGAIASAVISEPREYGPDVPLELAELANAACHIDPAARPVSAHAFREALARYLRHRDSVALAAEAIARMPRIRELAGLEALDEDAHRELDRAATEARFGLEQSLRRWRNNAPARAALTELEVILETRRARVAALERDERERDPSVARGPRKLGLTLLSFIGIGSTVSALLADGPPSPLVILAYPLSITIAMALGVVLLRRTILRTVFNRRLLQIVFLAMGMMILDRALGLVVPTPPTEHFIRDSLALGGIFLATAVAYLRWLVWLGVAFILSAVGCVLLPAHSLVIFAVVASLTMVMAAFFTWRGDR